MYTKFLRAPDADGRVRAVFCIGDFLAAARGAMRELLADRFLCAGARWIDLATGRTVRVHIAPAGSRSQQHVWADRCAALASLRHPLINPLIDYGIVDSQRRFEAYAVGRAVAAGRGAAPRLLTHAVRFLESHGVALTRAIAPLAMREVVDGPLRRGRALGIVLQRRIALDHVVDALTQAAPGGVSGVVICGPDGCGIRTLCTLSARAARLQGYIPIATRVLTGFPELMEHLRDRHVVLVGMEQPDTIDRHVVAAYVTRLGASSARRHVFLQFRRESFPRGIEIEAMGVTAMSAMVFIEPRGGPSPEELFQAIRYADGRPGRLVERLRALHVDPDLTVPAFVHETTPAYVVSAGPALPALPRSRRIAGAVDRAESRAARLAAAGRHASAIRLLQRAARVFEARGERHHASACRLRLGWIFRNRGRTESAASEFERARVLAGDTAVGVNAAIALGVAWTDDERLIEAEAVLRSAQTAAGVLLEARTNRDAAVALGRCLFWQRRYAEAAAAIALALEAESATDAWALLARIRLASEDPTRALRAAGEAVRHAERASSVGEVAAACRAMAATRAAVGDLDGARDAIARGLRAAASAHLPLLALRLRAILLGVLQSSSSTAGEAARLAARLRTAADDAPRLLRTQLRAACSSPSQRSRESRCGDTIVGHVRSFLELVQTAADDRAAVEAISRALSACLRAVTVLVVSAEPDVRILWLTGRPTHGTQHLALRAIATGAPAHSNAEPFECAVAVRYGADRIAAVVCRWTAGTSVDAETAIPVAEAAALAMAASIRGLMDRASPPPPDSGWGDLLGTSPAAVALREATARAARAPFPVLVEGESGSGKELVARAIHRFSTRRDRRLCTVNCAAIADDLLEAELFGHARGAFTGATNERAGLFEEADGGTLFLDEVGELSARAQAKLLRVLQDGELRRIGENMPRRVDTRFIAATNRRLDQEVEAGRFRADLRFRLDVVRIAVPPLRDRAVDIPLLADHFWREASERVSSRATLSPETIAALTRYDWPGNVRELQNVIASVAVHAPRRGRIPPSLLPSQLARVRVDETSFEAARQEFERRFVRAALARANNQRARAARMLGVTRQGLAKMLRRLEIDA